MEHNKDIGKAIREKLETLDRTPHHDLWQSIQADLPKKRKRRILPFWLMFVSVAVVALLLYVVTDGFSNAKFWSPKTEQLQESPIATDRNGAVKNNDPYENPGEESGTAGIDGTTGTDNANGHERQQTGRANQLTGNDAESGNATSNGNGLESNDSGNGQGLRNNKFSKAGISVDGNTSGGKKASKKATPKWKHSRYAAAKNASDPKKSNRKKNRRNGKNTDPATAGGSDASRATGSELATQAGHERERTGEANQNNGSGNQALIGTGTAGSNASGQTKTTDASLTKTDSITKAIAEKEKKKKEKDKDTTKTEEPEAANYRTFSVFLYAAPTYYDKFSKISPIDNRLDSLPSRAEITYNYGGFLGFKYDDKWSVRIGVARTDLKHSTTGIPVSSLDQQNYYNLEYAGGVTNEDVAVQFAGESRFNLVQEISYLEFPIELKYKFLGKKISAEGIGGISTLFLKDNTVTAESDNSGSVIIGSVRGLYKAYFSANLGIGFGYNITDNLKLNVEPVFKYHLRTASVALQPYSIVILGGFEYTFNWNINKKKKTEK